MHVSEPVEDDSANVTLFLSTLSSTTSAFISKSPFTSAVGWVIVTDGFLLSIVAVMLEDTSAFKLFIALAFIVYPSLGKEVVSNE